MILIGMGAWEQANTLLREGMKQAPVTQIPYYRRLLLLIDLRAERHQALLAQANQPQATDALEDKVVYLHVFAVNRELRQARRLRQELTQQADQMNPQTRQAFHL